MTDQEMEVRIAARAIADRKIDDAYGFGKGNELRDAEYQRLLQEHAQLGENSEVGRAIAARR